MGSTFTISQSPSSANLWLYPNGDVKTELTCSDGSDNYALVDDDRYTSDNDATYVYSTDIANKIDLYSLPDHTIESGTINYVQVFARAKSHETAQNPSGIYKVAVSYSGATSGCTYVSTDNNIITGYDLCSYVWTSNPSTSAAWTWDDVDNLVIGVQCSSPTVAGAAHSTTFRPNAVGHDEEFSGTGDNYLFVDEETADDDSTYIYNSSDAWKIDLYNIPDHTTETGTIANVTVFCRAKGVFGVKREFFKPTIYISSTTYEGDQFTTGGNYATKSHTWSQNPATSGTWSWNDIDSLQIGVTGRRYDSTLRVTQVYAVVNYNENINPEIRTTQCYAKVNYTPTATDLTLNQPQSLSVSHGRNLRKFNKWSGGRVVFDLERTERTLSISGTELSSAATTMESLRTFANNGEYVTISGLDDTRLNTTWHIIDFSCTEEGGHNDHVYNWNMTLEKA